MCGITSGFSSSGAAHITSGPPPPPSGPTCADGIKNGDETELTAVVRVVPHARSAMAANETTIAVAVSATLKFAACVAPTATSAALTAQLAMLIVAISASVSSPAAGDRASVASPLGNAAVLAIKSVSTSSAKAHSACNSTPNSDAAPVVPVPL